MILPNLNHLKYFVDAVELGSISASADKNLVTHPAVSRAISAMENQLGIKLLEHKKKSFEVTPIGHTIAQKAKHLLTATAEFQSTTKVKMTEISGPVSIGLSRTLGQAYLPTILKAVSQIHPQVKLHIRIATVGELLEKLTQNTIDLGITLGHQKMPTLKQSLLTKGNFVLIQSSQSPKLKSNSLIAENFILTEPRYETELLKKQFYKKYKSELIVKHEVGSWDAITQLVTEGFGIGLVPELAIQAKMKKDITIFQPAWFSCPFEIYLNQSQLALKNPAAKATAELIEHAVK